VTALLRSRTVADFVRQRGAALPAEALAIAAPIVEDVRRRGEAALREHAARFGDLAPGERLVVERPALERALTSLDCADRERLDRVAGRIRAFAEAQRRSLVDVTVPVPGGAAGHRVLPVERAGCYAPGGRYPLPSSILMTVVSARVAGVRQVWVASPRPTPLVLAAAAIAGADALLAAGGAQAIAALAYGAGPVPPCDVVVGPGNRYVTAAKQLVSSAVGIDMLAGPSELVVFADGSADPGLVADDLLAQAEHDPDTVPVLLSLDPTLPPRVDAELRTRLADLPTAAVARAALGNGGAVAIATVDDGVAACDAIAPEHLELHLAGAAAVAQRLRNYGALFIGVGASAVLADYGAGPNHTLPTSGTAHWAGGLSVFTFLRARTWLQLDDAVAAGELAADAAWFARLEGLEAHVRAAEGRLVRAPNET
jgi:phosphoribosyl-ATP pyrophosphohydrolase/phosphoribosyl-AMP cyclohydrolase/histidinol dehydrogenase